MEGIIIEATNGIDWSSFLVISTQDADFADAAHPLLQRAGWSTRSVWVLDLRSGFGVMVWADGSTTDQYLSVKGSPLFHPFLSWLMTEDFLDPDALPRHIDLSSPTQTIHIEDLVVDVIDRDSGYEIVHVRDHQNRPIYTDVDLDRIEAALDNADSIKRKRPMERVTGRKETHKRHGTG